MAQHSPWADATPSILLPSAGNMFGAEAEMGDLNFDENDPKRRRIARACDMCRKKKIKCDGKLPKCGHCLNYKTECVFTQVEKKRHPPKGAKYIEGLENRLGRMEALLKMSGLLTEEEAGRTDLGTLEKRLAEKTRLGSTTGPSTSPTSSARASISARPDSQGTTPLRDAAPSPRDSVASPTSASDKEKSQDVENLSDMMCSLVTRSNGEARYIGSSSAFSIFSQKGIDWVNEKTGDNSFEETIQRAAHEEETNQWQQWKPEIFGDLFVRRVFKPLPPREEAMSLFQDFFENFNCMFPLFHEPTFMHLAKRQYSSNPYEGSGWWASINVALAISHRLRVMSDISPQQDDQKAWMYLKNALGVLTELTMRNQDLLSVQALFGMALFLQGTPNPQPGFALVSAGLRLAHSIGLHKKGTGFNLHPVEAEQRKRVFWIGYMLDKDSSLRSGRPSVLNDDDMNVDLPAEDPPDNVGNIPLSDGKGKVNLFRILVEFCRICSRVYRELYSVKASMLTDGELLNTIGELDTELESWKDRIPIEIRPEHEIKSVHTPLVFQIVVLHFSYYNCLTTIHRMAVHHGYWTDRLSEYAVQGLNSTPLNPRVFSSAALCVAAARAAIHLIKYLPQGDFACVWLIIYYPVSSLVTIFANVLQNPQDSRAKADLKLMDLVVNFISNVAAEEGTGSFRRMLAICSEFTRIAKLVTDKAEKEGTKRKRKGDAEDSQARQDAIRQGAIAQAQEVARANGVTLRALSDPRNGMRPPNGPVASDQALGLNGPQLPHLDTGSLPGQNGGIGEFDFGDMSAGTPFTPTFADGNVPPGMAAYGIGAFQQPFVPQDLWQMPMTFEWDLAQNFESTNDFPTLDATDELNLGNNLQPGPM